jgi:hypothetical protein
MIKSIIESIVKLPLQKPVETAARSKKETALKSLVIRAEPIEQESKKDIEELKQAETSRYPKGYIKYPAHDFF